MPISQNQAGYTYVELMLAVTLGGMLVLGLTGLVGNTLETQQSVHDKTDLTRQAGEAMSRMRKSILHSRRLLLPLSDNPNTDWPEHVREETVPASPPTGSSTKATAVLAVTLPAYFDLNNDGTPDADNDGDGLIDEDPGADSSSDNAPGIILIDDNGDGSVDDSTAGDPNSDDDEDDNASEETVNYIDDDGDGGIDEDLSSDANGDGESGISGVDDDGDGLVDEANPNDDDEDGLIDEDGYDALVFYLDNGTLKVRTPVPWDENTDTQFNGRDFVVSELAGHVSRLRIERLSGTSRRQQLVDLTLAVTVPATGEVINFHQRVRIGGAL